MVGSFLNKTEYLSFTQTHLDIQKSDLYINAEYMVCTENGLKENTKSGYLWGMMLQVIFLHLAL